LTEEDIVILWSENGIIKSSEKVRGDLRKVVKEAVRRSVDFWDADKSDLVVLRDIYPMSVKLPLTKEQYDKYASYNLRRAGDEATFEVPVYFISYDNEWKGDSYVDHKMVVVAPRIDDFVEKALCELAESSTKETERNVEEEFLEEEFEDEGGLA